MPENIQTDFKVVFEYYLLMISIQYNIQSAIVLKQLEFLTTPPPGKDPQHTITTQLGIIIVFLCLGQQ